MTLYRGEKGEEKSGKSFKGGMFTFARHQMSLIPLPERERESDTVQYRKGLDWGGFYLCSTDG